MQDMGLVYGDTNVIPLMATGFIWFRGGELVKDGLDVLSGWGNMLENSLGMLGHRWVPVCWVNGGEMRWWDVESGHSKLKTKVFTTKVIDVTLQYVDLKNQQKQHLLISTFWWRDLFEEWNI